MLLNCEHYTPCIQCQQNRALNEDQLCEQCVKPVKGKAAAPPPVEPAIAEHPATSQEVSPVNFRAIVTPPGVPHPNYTEQQRDYYKTNWENYVGYFRDPSAYPLIHHMIMMEIELMAVANEKVYLMQLDGDNDPRLKALEQRETKLISNMELLRRSLPEKEAQEMTDDEKSIAAILERYTQLKKSRYQGGVSRIMSPHAIALAPVLPHKLNLGEILRRLGYKAISVEEALDKVTDPQKLPRNPIELAEFLGMFVRERVVAAEDEDELPELPEGLINDEDSLSTEQ